MPSAKGLMALASAARSVPGVVRKTKRIIRDGFKIGKNAVRLAGRVTKPKAIAKTVQNAARGQGVTLPGSKYIGPGNPMNRGKPRSRADALAYQHDIDYDNYIRAGVPASKVYTRYSDADERLRYASSKQLTKDPSAIATYIGMTGKKLLYQSGLVGRVRDQTVYGNSKVPKTANPYQNLANKYLTEIK